MPGLGDSVLNQPGWDSKRITVKLPLCFHCATTLAQKDDRSITFVQQPHLILGFSIREKRLSGKWHMIHKYGCEIQWKSSMKKEISYICAVYVVDFSWLFVLTRLLATFFLCNFSCMSNMQVEDMCLNYSPSTWSN